MTDREMSFGTGGTSRSRAGSQTGDMIDTTQGAASESHQKPRQQAEMGREKTAESIGRAATQLREKAARQGGKTGDIGTKVADRLESTSDYLEQHDTGEILDDFEKYVRDHPLQAVGAAAVGGFILARILR